MNLNLTLKQTSHFKVSPIYRLIFATHWGTLILEESKYGLDAPEPEMLRELKPARCISVKTLQFRQGFLFTPV